MTNSEDPDQTAPSGMTNSEDPDQTAPSGAVWSGSALFAYGILSETLVFEILEHLPYQDLQAWNSSNMVQHAHSNITNEFLQFVISVTKAFSKIYFLFLE